jgi:hypothetical protein
VSAEAAAAGGHADSRRRIETAVLLGWIAVGLAFRVAQTFPFHRFTAESDAILPALGALRVLDGDWPVFYSGFRIGAFCSYLTAAVFAVFGRSRESLAVEPLVACTLLLAAWAGLVRCLAGPEVARWALPFVAVPTWSFALWTYEPLAYGELYLAFVAILWAAVAARRRRTLATYALFGLLAGFGWWTSPLTLGASAPAALWLLPALLGRGGAASAAGRPRFGAAVAVMALAAVAGAAPWILFNLRYGFPSFVADYSARPASGLRQMVDNAAYFATMSVRELTASEYRAPGAPELGDARRLLQDAAGALGIGLFAAYAVLLLRRRRAPERGGDANARAAWALVLLVVTAVAALNVVSFAGSLRGFTGRYVGPIYLVLPIAYGTVLRGLSQRARGVAVALVAVALVAHLDAAMLPGDPERRLAERQLVRDRELRRALRASGVRTVYGEYWATYHLNFPHSGFVVVPSLPGYDYARFARRIEPGAAWAIVLPDEITARWLKHSPAARDFVARRVPIFYIEPERVDRMTPAAIATIPDWWWVPDAGAAWPPCRSGGDPRDRFAAGPCTDTSWLEGSSTAELDLAFADGFESGTLRMSERESMARKPTSGTLQLPRRSARKSPRRKSPT